MPGNRKSHNEEHDYSRKARARGASPESSSAPRADVERDGPGSHYSERASKPWADPDARRAAPRQGGPVYQPEEDYDEENLEFVPNAYGGHYERKDMLHRYDTGTGPDSESLRSGQSSRAAGHYSSGALGVYEPARGGGHRGKGPKGYKPSDERLKERLEEAFYDDDYLDASNIEVLVSNGEVTLQGAVASRDDRRRAEAVVERISGEHIHINNNLRVSHH